MTEDNKKRLRCCVSAARRTNTRAWARATAPPEIEPALGIDVSFGRLRTGPMMVAAPAGRAPANWLEGDYLARKRAQTQRSRNVGAAGGQIL